MATKAKSTKKNPKTVSKASKTKVVKTTKQTNAEVKLPGAFESFKPSMNAFVQNIGTFLALFFIPILIIFGGGLLALSLALFALSMRSVELAGMSLALFIIIALIALIVGMIFAPAVPYTQIRSVRGEHVDLKPAIRTGRHYFWRFYGLCISIGFVVVVGLIFFIIPGIIFIRRYYLAIYFLIDQDLKVFESMRRSSAATKGHSGAVWGVVGVGFLCGMVGAVPYLGGMVATVLQTLYSCAPAMRYDQLK